jgi:hypothetical protein
LLQIGNKFPQLLFRIVTFHHNQVLQWPQR